MCHACTPILMDVASPVSEILLLSKTVKFPFQTMDLQSIVVKKINQSELAQNIHANRGRCEMHGNQLGWGGLSGFGDLFTFINGQISLRTMDYKSMGSKIKLAQKNSCK